MLPTCPAKPARMTHRTRRTQPMSALFIMRVKKSAETGMANSLGSHQQSSVWWPPGRRLTAIGFTTARTFRLTRPVSQRCSETIALLTCKQQNAKEMACNNTSSFNLQQQLHNETEPHVTCRSCTPNAHRTCAWRHQRLPDCTLPSTLHAHAHRLLPRLQSLQHAAAHKPGRNCESLSVYCI